MVGLHRWAARVVRYSKGLVRDFQQFLNNDVK